MKKLQFGALSSFGSGEDEELREHVENETKIEAATRGKPMKGATADKESTPADVAPEAGGSTPGTAAPQETPKAVAAEGASPSGDAPKDVSEDEEDPDVIAAREEREAEERAAAARAAQATGAGLAGSHNTDDLMNDLLSRVGNAPAGAAAQAPVAPVQMAPVSGGVALGDAMGHIAAGVVAAPFVALTSAYRLLKQAVKPGEIAPGAAQPQAGASGIPGMAASAQPGLAAGVLGGAPIATAEIITNWKCDKIEDARDDVLKRAEAIRTLDAFPVWEDAALAEAARRGVLMQDMLSTMGADPDLAPLREQMTSLWRDNPKAVDDYKRAADTFEKHIKDVQKKFANSEPPVQKRVIEAMESVREGVSDMPGFGKQEGEYGATLADRLRELARVLAEFVAGLLARLQGMAKGQSRTATATTPDLTG